MPAICDLCEEPLEDHENDGEYHDGCLEQIYCPICYDRSDYCRGHGEEEKKNHGDCKICDEHIDDCHGHGMLEIREYEEKKENDKKEFHKLISSDSYTIVDRCC